MISQEPNSVDYFPVSGINILDYDLIDAEISQQSLKYTK